MTLVFTDGQAAWTSVEIVGNLEVTALLETDTKGLLIINELHVLYLMIRGKGAKMETEQMVIDELTDRIRPYKTLLHVISEMVPVDVIFEVGVEVAGKS